MPTISEFGTKRTLVPLLPTVPERTTIPITRFVIDAFRILTRIGDICVAMVAAVTATIDGKRPPQPDGRPDKGMT